MATPQVIVAPLKTEDASAVRQLLIAGLTERWGSYEASFNPDIEGFPGSYADPFVLVAKQGSVVVGTGTIRQTGASRAEIVRMSVAASSRRTGIGSLILSHLLEFARESGQFTRFALKQRPRGHRRSSSTRGTASSRLTSKVMTRTFSSTPVKPNPSFKPSPNSVARRPSSAGPAAHFALAVQRATLSVPA